MCSVRVLGLLVREGGLAYERIGWVNRSGLGVDDTMRTDRILAGIGGKRLTYRRSGEAAHA